MSKYLITILLLLIPKVALCLIDTLKVSTIDENSSERIANFRVKIDKKAEKKIIGTLNISTQFDSVAISLIGKIIEKDTLFSMEDSSNNALNKIYDLLACQESDLKKKYFSSDTLSKKNVFNYLINQIFGLPNRQLTLVISPKPSNDSVTNIAFFSSKILWGIIGLLTLGIGILTYLYLMAKKSNKTLLGSDPLKDKINQIKEELGMKGNYSDLSVLENVLSKYFESIQLSKDYRDLSLELENTKQKHEQDLQEIETKTKQEKEYLFGVLNEYILPFLGYFKDDTDYPATSETQQKLIENLIPLAFHFISFVKSKQGSANELEKQNLQQFSSQKGGLTSLKTVDFSANESNTDNKLVLHVIDILKKYGVNELKNVNINGYLIKNTTSND